MKFKGILYSNLFYNKGRSTLNWTIILALQQDFVGGSLVLHFYSSQCNIYKGWELHEVNTCAPLSAIPTGFVETAIELGTHVILWPWPQWSRFPILKRGGISQATRSVKCVKASFTSPKIQFRKMDRGRRNFGMHCNSLQLK